MRAAIADRTFQLIGSEKIWDRGQRCLRACIGQDRVAEQDENLKV